MDASDYATKGHGQLWGKVLKVLEQCDRMIKGSTSQRKGQYWQQVIGSQETEGKHPLEFSQLVFNKTILPTRQKQNWAGTT